MMHADDVNATRGAKHVSKSMDATAIVHPVPIQTPIMQVHVAMMHADDVNATGGTKKHVCKSMDVLPTHPTLASLNAKKEAIRVSTQERKIVGREKLQTRVAGTII